MTAIAPSSGSLRRRLIIQLLGIAAVLSALLYITVRAVADQAAEATQDNILGASAAAIAEQLRAADEGIVVDIPYSAFAMLGAVSEEQVFYRIIAGSLTITGYEDLPTPQRLPGDLAPVYYSATYRETDVRIVALKRTVPVENKPLDVTVMVAQTRLGQEAIAARVANVAAGLGIGFFVIAGILSLIAAQSALRPIRRVVEAVGRRGPSDLRPLQHPAPRELAPLLGALNGFMARLRGALDRTETFIAEAAHHIRTPLATVRTQAEIALRQADNEDSRKTLRAVVRAVEESSRSASQLLDHATVIYRSDHMVDDRLDIGSLTQDLVDAYQPTAELKDISIELGIETNRAELSGDRVMIESALRNMLDNAIKYSPAEEPVRIEVRDAGDFVEIAISDKGRGLDGASQTSLTKRFGRGENVDDIVGSGLGLTIVEEVAQAHGGRFDLKQQPEGGTCAIFSLPRH